MLESKARRRKRYDGALRHGLRYVDLVPWGLTEAGLGSYSQLAANPGGGAQGRYEGYMRPPVPLSLPCPPMSHRQRYIVGTLHGPGLWVFPAGRFLGRYSRTRQTQEGLFASVVRYVPYLPYLRYLDRRCLMEGWPACYLRSLRSKTQRARQGVG